MKLFKSLLVAPATLGLLAPMAASANEVTINDFNAAEEIAVTNSRVDGLEARFNNLEAGSFSETTTASFGVDFLVGAVDGASSEVTTFDYQMGIGLETSFTGEDSLSATIDIGETGSVVGGTDGLNFDSTTKEVPLSKPITPDDIIDGEPLPLSIAMSRESSPVKLVDNPMLN